MSIAATYLNRGTRNGLAPSLVQLGEYLQKCTQRSRVVHVNDPDQVCLLRSLHWDGVNRFAESYGMDVRIRARGTAFDFMSRDPDATRSRL
jgi:hypothetical protein